MPDELYGAILSRLQTSLQPPQFILQRCFAAKPRKCFVDYGNFTWLSWAWADTDWILIHWRTYPLKYDAYLLSLPRLMDWSLLLTCLEAPTWPNCLFLQGAKHFTYLLQFPTSHLQSSPSLFTCHTTYTRSTAGLIQWELQTQTAIREDGGEGTHRRHVGALVAWQSAGLFRIHLSLSYTLPWHWRVMAAAACDGWLIFPW